MGSFHQRQSFIPYSRADVVELCATDGLLHRGEAAKFRTFCGLLNDYHHYRFHRRLEQLKVNYQPLDPDRASLVATEVDETRAESRLMKVVDELLKSANYHEFTLAQLKQAFRDSCLVKLQLKVNFHDFDRLKVYWRGCSRQGDHLVYDRVVMIMKPKPASYFRKRGDDLEKLRFTPGKVHVYHYKNIPRADLEILFPNLEVTMIPQEKLKVGIPALIASVPVVLNVIPQMGSLCKALAFLVLGPAMAAQMGLDPTLMGDVMPLIAGTMTFAMGLGGFGCAQASKLRKREGAFHKTISDTLFSRQLDSNSGVFHTLLDAAEEEECKEMILAYYHLLVGERTTARELDDKVEEWLLAHSQTEIDFDVDKAVTNLKQTMCKSESGPVPLLCQERRGELFVLQLEEARAALENGLTVSRAA